MNEVEAAAAREISRNRLWRRFLECMEEFQSHGMTEGILRAAQENKLIAMWVAALPKECIEKFQARALTEALLRSAENNG